MAIRAFLLLPCLLATDIARAADWHAIGTTKTHYDAQDIEPCTGLNDELRAEALRLGGSCAHVHTDAYTEARKFLVDLQSIHREGPYLYHWEETDVSFDGKNWSKESLSLVVTDCEEQKRKIIEYVSYSGDKIITHFVHGESYCDVFSTGDVRPCWPRAWGEPSWDHVVPDSIGEEELHFVCTHLNKKEAPHP